MKFLIISCHAPYKGVGHAGGKTIYYYTNQFNRLGHDLSLLTLVTGNEIEKLKEEDCFEKCYTILLNTGLVDKVKRKIKSIFLSLKKQYRNPMMQSILVYQLIKKLKLIKIDGYNPDLIILEYTEIVMMAKYVKRLFPETKIVASEHDVSFLRYLRYYENTTLAKKRQAMKKFNSVRTAELHSLTFCDLICTHNDKDLQLLVENGVENSKIISITPYYDNYADVCWRHLKKWIIFFGAMNRPENYESALWFIDQVIPLIKHKDAEFLVIGNRPAQQLKEYDKDNIHIMGYVKEDDLRTILSECCLMVSPLLSGAGIKVKILEIMSAGVPVVTNYIGIEGIPAKKNIDYIYAETADEYAFFVNRMLDDIELYEEMSKNAKNFIIKNYKLQDSADLYMKHIDELFK